MLQRAGYSGTKPEVLSAYDKVFYEITYGNANVTGEELVDCLWRTHRPDDSSKGSQWLTLEEQVCRDNSEGGMRLSEFFTVVRHSMLLWVVSTAARPRDRFGQIDTTRPIKRFIVAPEFTAHLTDLFETDAYARLVALVRSKEEEELALGELAQCGAEERHVREDIQKLAPKVADIVATSIGQVTADVDDEVRDKNFYLACDIEEQSRFKNPSTDTLDWTEIRSVRIRREQRALRDREVGYFAVGGAAAGLVSFTNQHSPPPPPTVGLASRLTLAPLPVAPLPVASLPVAPLPVASLPVSPPTLAPVSPVVASTPATSLAVVADCPNGVLPVAPVFAIAAPVAPDIGSPLWQELPLDERIQTLQPIKNLMSLTGSIQTGGIPQMLRLWFKTFAPLERIPAKRGHEWRSTRYCGKTMMESFSDSLNKQWLPILCRVVERMDEQEGMSIWTAAEELEALRIQKQTFDQLLSEPSIERFRKGELRAPFTARLQDETFANDARKGGEESTRDCGQVQTPPDDEAMLEATDSTTAGAPSPLVAPIVESAVTRILGIDPAIHTGVSIVQLDAEGRVLSIHVAVLDVSDALSDGARGSHLQELLSTFLSPPPDHIYVESYFSHGRETDAVGIKLRMAIEMLLHLRGLTYDEVTPQAWKKAVGCRGKAESEPAKEKARVREVIEAAMGYTFPPKVYLNGSQRADPWSADKQRLGDASDAAGTRAR